jgi:hypothetical protein
VTDVVDSRRIRIKTEAGCVTNHDMIKLFKHLKKFDADVHVMGQIMTRKMVEVTIENKRCYVDIITGTVYDKKTGRCNSVKVWIDKVYKI